MARHIFVDNSNIFGGAQRAAQTLEPNAIWLAVRVYYRNLFQLFASKDCVATRILAGSIPPDNENLWAYAREQGYDTDLLRRVERDDGRLVEQAVDEMLHLRIANALLDYETPQALVIASGDGNTSEMGTSFPMQAMRALRREWTVEIWSWEGQLSGRFASLKTEYPELLSVHTLDPYYRSITFVKAGTYEIGASTVTVHGRVVSALRPQ